MDYEIPIVGEGDEDYAKPHVHVYPEIDCVRVVPCLGRSIELGLGAHQLRHEWVGPPGRLRKFFGATWARDVNNAIRYWQGWLASTVGLDRVDRAEDARAVANDVHLEHTGRGVS